VVITGIKTTVKEKDACFAQALQIVETDVLRILLKQDIYLNLIVKKIYGGIRNDRSKG
jgi:hypothetical protein